MPRDTSGSLAKGKDNMQHTLMQRSALPARFGRARHGKTLEIASALMKPERRRPVLAASALLLTALAWPLLTPGPAQAVSRRVSEFAASTRVIEFSASIDPRTKVVSDAVLTGLTLPQGVTIDPQFESGTHSYTLSVPASVEQLGFPGRFTSPPYDDWGPWDNGFGAAFGVAMVGTSTELHTRIDDNNSHHVVTTDQHAFWLPRIVDLQPPGSSTTIVIRVYKRLSKRRWIHDPKNAVWKNYTLTVERELLQQQVQGSPSTGTEAATVMRATNGRLTGGDGNDVLHGGAGADVLRGGRGNDRLHGQNGSDRLYGGPGDDELHGGAGNDQLHGNEDDDVL